MMIKEINVRIQKSRNIYSVSYIKVKEQFFNNWIICKSSYLRHGTKYIVMIVGLAESL